MFQKIEGESAKKNQNALGYAPLPRANLHLNVFFHSAPSFLGTALAFHSCSCSVSFSYLFGSCIQFSWAWFSAFYCHKNKAGLQIGPPKCDLLCQIRWCGRSGLAIYLFICLFIYLFIALEVNVVPRRLPELCGMGILFQFTPSYSGCKSKSFGCSWSNCDSSCFSFSLGIIFFKKQLHDNDTSVSF